MVNKKLVLSFSFLLLLSLTIFISAEMISQPNGNFEVSIDLQEGWTIIAGTVPEDGISSDSEIQISDIEAMWYYSPASKEYIGVYPNPEMSKLQQADDDVVLTSAMWIYSKKAGTLKYDTLEDYPSLENRQLLSGYNFVTITPDMTGKDLDQIKGNCEVNKLYHFEPRTQSFISALEEFDQMTSSGENAGYGFVIEVTNDCNLGYSTSTTTPPSIPGNNNNNLGEWNNYIYEGDIEELDYIKTFLDIERASCLLLKISGECSLYSGQYKSQKEDSFASYVEIYEDLSREDFINAVEDTYSNVGKGDFLDNDYYILYESDDDVKIMWYQENKVIVVGTIELREGMDDRLEDMLMVYLPKYPSELNW